MGYETEKGGEKKKKKKVKTVSGRGSCRIRYNRISSLRKINESAFEVRSLENAILPLLLLSLFPFVIRD